MMNELEHKPVMLNEILSAFAEGVSVRMYYDGTFGRGGHVREIFNRWPEVRAWVSDKDPAAIEFCQKAFAEHIQSGRLNLKQMSYLQAAKELRAERLKFDIALLDLGVSSPQLDQAERGFSFYQDGPLDMRMDLNQELSAATVVNEYPENELIEIFRQLGEVPSPYRVVRAIVHDRKQTPFTTTVQLAGLIERVDKWRKKGQHPATKYFLALRLLVNSELEELRLALPLLIENLNEGGRLAVLSFHSLEDRIVKQCFRSSLALGSPVNKKVIVSGDEELHTNPRARSAKLRVFERKSHVS